MKAIGVIGIAVGAAIFGGIATSAYYEFAVVTNLESQKLDTARYASPLIQKMDECQASISTQTDALLATTGAYSANRHAVDRFFTRGDSLAGDADSLYFTLYAQAQVALDAMTSSNDDQSRAACAD